MLLRIPPSRVFSFARMTSLLAFRKKKKSKSSVSTGILLNGWVEVSKFHVNYCSHEFNGCVENWKRYDMGNLHDCIWKRHLTVGNNFALTKKLGTCMFQWFAFKRAAFVFEWFKEKSWMFVLNLQIAKNKFHKSQATSMALVTTAWTNQILLFFEASW